MSGSLRDLLQDVLHDLNARGPSARNRADLGDPRALTELLPEVLAERGARVLADAGARTDLEGEAPKLAATWFAWLEADLEQEARWRSRLAASRRSFGEVEVDIAGLCAALADEDPARREAAWQVSEKFWGAPIEALGWLEESAQPRRTPSAATTSSGILIPDANMVAAVLTGQIDDQPEGSDTTEGDEGVRLADLIGVIEVARALCEAVEVPPTSWATWQFAIRGVGRDFRGAHRPTGALPFPRPLVPLTRAEGRAKIVGHDARDLVLRELVSNPARLGAALSRSFVQHELEAARGDAIEWIRQIALALAGVVIESALSEVHRGDVEALVRSTRWVAGTEAPMWWAELASRTPAAAALPGESSSLYLHSGATWRRVCLGLQDNLLLRERFDEDWFRDERALAAELPLDRGAGFDFHKLAEELRTNSEL